MQASRGRRRVWWLSVSIRVVLADDSLIVREGIHQLLEHEAGIEVVASCGDLDEVSDAVRTLRPDVVVTDIRMPPSHTNEGIRLAEAMRGSEPTLGVVVLSQFSEPEYVLALLESGSDRRAYLLKEHIHDRHRLTEAIRDVAAGGYAIDATVIDALVAGRARRDSPLQRLSPRELDVLREVAQGKSNAAIAGSLVLTKSAVEKHINSIFGKLELAGAQDVSQRVKAALIFLEGSG
jgi:DNA-binding NarL/FixJ family response regulator